MKNEKRIERLLQKFAPQLGGTDENGNKISFPPKEVDARQKQHIFWIFNRDEDNVAGAFVPGNVIKSKIRDDSYDIDYIGKVTDSNVRVKVIAEDGTVSYEWRPDDELTKDQKAFKAKFQKYLKKQEEQIAAAKHAKRVRAGEFFDVD